MRSRSAVAAISVAICACGDNNKPRILPDAHACSTVRAGTLEFERYLESTFIVWKGPILGDIGDGLTIEYKLEFYANLVPSLQGTFDLGVGDLSNYGTCAICVRATARDANGNAVRQYFQSAGTVTLAADPVATGRVQATFTGLELAEV